MDSREKNLLSTTFWMLTMIAYFYYTKKKPFRSTLNLCDVLSRVPCQAHAGNLPFVLLLLDYWPWRGSGLPQWREDKSLWKSFYGAASRLVLEKVP
jgi:hypothetical protein